MAVYGLKIVGLGFHGVGDQDEGRGFRPLLLWNSLNTGFVPSVLIGLRLNP